MNLKKINLRKSLLAGIVSLVAFAGEAQSYDHHFLLAGASFAVPENGWFELVCEAFNAEPLNKAVSGDAIKHTASDMYYDRFYTTEELDRVDAFIIMHVHNQDVASTNGIKENYEDYTYDEIQQYNTAYDYVIKRYKADCYNLKFNPESRYYQTENGKPATIILCTHWHDSRISYNQAIRTLAERWQLPLIKLDDNIGFTRKVLDEDGRQPSLKYAADTEKIYDITFGWHPLRGKEQYIQQKIAQIAMEELSNLFTPVPASATLEENSRAIAPGEPAYFTCRFTGIAPWNLTYTVNGEEVQLNDITENPTIIEVDPAADKTTVVPVAVSNPTTESGTVSGQAEIFTCQQAISPTFDTYVHQANKTTTYTDADHLEIKGNTDTHTRESFLSFPAASISPDAERIVLRAYYYDCIYPSWPRKETHPVEIAGNTQTYTTMTWDTKPTDFTPIGKSLVLGNDLNSYYNANAFTENTKSSTVNMTYRVPNSPWSFSATANVTQRTQDSTLNVSFPNLTISMGQVYPFKRKTVVGNERWYERIQLSYSGRFQNSILTKQDQILKSNLIKDWRNGMYHNIPISATFNLFKYLNLTASFNFTDRMYTNKVMQDWDTQQARVVRDTVYGFYNVYNYYGSLSADTKLYGFYTPWKIFGDKVQAIRHIFTPTISFSAAPDFSAPRYGFWDSYSYVNEYGETVTTKYSPFSNGVYGTVSQGRQGTVSFAVSNNLEMKVKSDRDSTGVRKISLIENLSANMSYNMAADSMKWSNLNTSILIKLTKNFNLQMSAVWDTYTYQLDRYGNPVRVNKPRWTVGKGIGRLSSTGTSFSYTFNNDTFKKKDKDSDSKNTQQQRQQPNALPTDPNSGDEEEEAPGDSDVQFGPDGYSIWEIPWSLSINYSVNYGYGTFNKKKMEYNGRFTQNLSLSGNINLTKNWSFNFSASYDFNAKKIAYMNCNVTRDMHCWSMSASFVPVGPYKSYNFHISVKSSLLQDLKYDKHGNSYNSLDWY